MQSAYIYSVYLRSIVSTCTVQQAILRHAHRLCWFSSASLGDSAITATCQDSRSLFSNIWAEAIIIQPAIVTSHRTVFSVWEINCKACLQDPVICYDLGL